VHHDSIPANRRTHHDRRNDHSRNQPRQEHEMSITLNKTTRRNWTIMLAGLYASMFRRDPQPSTLTRWVDLEEEISNV